MAIKLDLGKAWEDAVGLLTANKDVVLIIAAVFFFLPGAISGVISPEPTELNAMLASGGNPDPDDVSAVFLGYFQQVWWIYLLNALITAIGSLSLFALLRSSQRPTVGEAIAIGVRSLPTYIVITLLMAICASIAIAVPAILGALVHPALGAVLSVVGLVIAIYLSVKFSLTSPIVAVDGVLNPVTAMVQSWKLTRGNSLRLFAFYVLLGICLIVMTLIVSLLLGIFAVFGDQVGLFAGSIGGALFGMLTTSVFLAVIAAAHRQLSGGPQDQLGKAFE